MFNYGLAGLMSLHNVLAECSIKRKLKIVASIKIQNRKVLRLLSCTPMLECTVAADV